jgi:Lipocalin-like domain
MNRRNIISLSAMAALGLAILPSNAVAQTKSLKDQLVGTWTLVSAESAAKDGTKIPFIEGTNLNGLLVLDASGRISFQVMTTLPKLASNDRLKSTPAEDKALAHGVLSYFGTYSVSDSDHVLTLHIEHSSFANQVGLDAKRTVSFNTQDEVKITTPTSLAGNTNNLVWKRLK